MTAGESTTSELHRIIRSLVLSRNELRSERNTWRKRAFAAETHLDALTGVLPAS